ncbi:MAG: type II toxin-antitoxin system Phd/YefM family antitoxin, partial [Clostridiales bacterium]|nr:type II toxin-antitoxin system Phd/YefM family antitoxin [Clostridiales bacterium]
SSTSLRNDYGVISELAHKEQEPIYITKNGEGDLVVMDIEAFRQREKMLELREKLVRVEEERLVGQMGGSPDDLEAYLDNVLEGVKRNGAV